MANNFKNIIDTELDIIKSIQSYSNPQINQLMELTSAPFHCKYFILILILLYFFGKLKSKQIILLGLSQVILFTLKYSIRRPRPFSTDPQVKLLEQMSFDPYSFPSGHTLNALLLVHILKRNFNIDIPWFPLIVGISRVYMGVHYPTDILGGLILYKILAHSITY
jgi:membrane-associated phospholipid phosphatase